MLDVRTQELLDLSGIAGADEHFEHTIGDGRSTVGFGFLTRSMAGSFVEASTTGGYGLLNSLLLHQMIPCLPVMGTY